MRGEDATAGAGEHYGDQPGRGILPAGDMSADEAGAVIYDRLFGEHRLSHPQQQ